MAMITCPKCGRLVSEKAICCPGCGESIANATVDAVEATIDKQDESVDLNDQMGSGKADEEQLDTSEIREREVSDAHNGIYVSKGMIIAIAITAIAVLGMVISLTYAASYKKALKLIAENREVQNETLITENTNTDSDDSSIDVQGEHENEKNNETADKVTEDKKADANQISQNDENETKTEKEPENKQPSGSNDNKNIVFSDDYIVNLDFEITNIDIRSNNRTEITFKITNNEAFPVIIHSQKYQYFDDVAIKRDAGEFQNPLAPGKSGICSLTFYNETINSSGIKKVGTYTMELYSEEDNGAQHPFEVIFSDINIKFN